MAEPKVRPLERKSQAETKWRQKMMDNQYSDYFHTLHDETQPVGNLGRGTHYSVLRYASWHDVELKRLDQPVTHDFSVIWDEDHDTRIISAIEKIFEAGLLAPIQFIGERKAFLSIVLAARFRYSGENDLVQEITSGNWRKFLVISKGTLGTFKSGIMIEPGPSTKQNLPG